MSYQPLLGLSWKYESGTGKLFIVAVIRLELDAIEHMNVAYSPVINKTVIVNIDIVTGVNNSPVTLFIEYYNIGLGLTSTDVVRKIIGLLPDVTVNVYVNVTPPLHGSGTTSANSEIIMA